MGSLDECLGKCNRLYQCSRCRAGIRVVWMVTCCQSDSLKAVRTYWATGAKQPGLHHSHLFGSSKTQHGAFGPASLNVCHQSKRQPNVSFWPAVCTATTAWQRWGAEGKDWSGTGPTVGHGVCVCYLLWFLTDAHIRAL